MWDDGSFVIAFFAIVVGIPVLAGLAKHMWRDFVRLRERQLERGADGAVNEALVARLERMEERLQVLERILTDRGHYLAEEIERLRTR
ncbi:MAG: hypothetical protein ACOY99_12165 [Pseudomonadota bacterium]